MTSACGSAITIDSSRFDSGSETTCACPSSTYAKLRVWFMKLIETLLESLRVKCPGKVCWTSNALSQGNLRWIALTSTMRVFASSEPPGKRSLILSLVCVSTQSLIVSRAES
ncbi:MAG TPA: hypothetical protein VHW01_19175 [Polyangiaceae bacterium]|nr:hypothetical protein [Polyangiaceae bacterium]